MAEQFTDLSDVLDGNLLELPVAGRTFVVPSPPALVGLRLQRVFAAASTPAKQRTNAQRDLLARDEEEFMRDALGPVFDEMADAGITLEVLKHAAYTAYFAVVTNVDVARAFWERPLGEAETSTSTDPEPSTTTPEATTATGSPSTTTSRPKKKHAS
ncbi:hypothetical protein GCM10025864_44520 [Luteimicrobium album]|uniref:DUF7426 domain-containing protein n=1 Tax=Luteimicrobium album TaxID=1054550 RepID=A0ABQ6HV55_9MICO|nr:hypothetical protein [Luteimicrobium album]GMA22287.1 hypothetical protein GCM10025864_00460 [Luteimicrobium album]GMA26693.1 hypothetical protein GCM10025864_44520 [Luteimicrobium album]